MRSLINLLIAGALFLIIPTAKAQNNGAYNAINSGVPWLDDRGNVVSAHGANMIKDNGRYYLFGEAHTDNSNAFAGFNCYSSADLYNWKFERVALPVQASGKLGPNRVGERVKVMKCPKTGEYIMYMHADTMSYNDQFVGYATSNNITGPYTFRGPLLFEGKPIRKWDMGTFQDKDGTGYVLLHGGDIYKLSGDYKSATEHVSKAFTPGFEAPTLFKKGNTYFFMGSDLTSWEKNDNYYYTAASLSGPWVKKGFFCPEGTLTWNSQSTFVLPIEGTKDTTYMYMGDRWAYPKQASAATYVWQPLTITGDALSIPTYLPSWRINIASGKVSQVQAGGNAVSTDSKLVSFSEGWSDKAERGISYKTADKKDEAATLTFSGRQIGVYGLLHPAGGYMRLVLTDKNGKVLQSALVDTYCKYANNSLLFLSKPLPKQNYTLTVTVSGEHGNWSDKKKIIYGSTGSFISLNKFTIANR